MPSKRQILLPSLIITLILLLGAGVWLYKTASNFASIEESKNLPEAQLLKKAAEEFCAKQGNGKRSPLLLFRAIGVSGEKRYYAICRKMSDYESEDVKYYVDSQIPYYDEIVFYDLKREDNGEFSVIWSKESGYNNDGFNWRSASLPDIKDIDNDKIDEMVIFGGGYSAMCGYGWNNLCVYNYKRGLMCLDEEEGWEQDLRALKKKWADKLCVATEIKPKEEQEVCPGNQIHSICFSDNLKDENNKIFKDFLENKIKTSNNSGLNK